MIYLFNESDTVSWELTEKNEYFFHLGVKGTKFGIDILKRDITGFEFFPGAFETMNYQNVVVCASTFFQICYNNKSGLPFLKPVVNPNEYSHDLFLITYRIPEGMEIINDKSGKFTIHYSKYDKENQCIHIVGSGKSANFPYFFLTFADNKQTKFITKHIVTLKKSSTISVFIQEYTKEQVEASEYKATILGKGVPTKIKASKVLTPYAVIVYPFSKPNLRTQFCEKKFSKDPDHTKYVDQEARSMISELKKLNIAGKYIAATFYIDRNADDITEDDMRHVRGANIFDRVNFLTLDGKIKSI